MANKAISELPQALNVNNQDLFVLEQSGIAKKLPAETFITEQGIIDALAEALDGHGGIQSVTLSSVSGRIRTYRITFSDGSATTFQVYDGTSIDRISRTSSSGLDDVYTVFLSDGTTTFFTVHNGADGTVSEAMLNDALKNKAPVITETTESSAIANFTDGADDLVMHNVIAEINPVQDLSNGDPSPDNICPITGHTEVNVTRTGANVWDEVWEQGGVNASDGTNYADTSPRIRSKNYIPVVPNTQYCFVLPNAVKVTVFYDINKQFISGSWNSTLTFTTPANAYYMRFSTNDEYGATYNNNISINYPATDTAYHAFKGSNSVSLSWQTEAGTVYGGTIDVATGLLTVDRATVELDTSWFWYIGNTQPTGMTVATTTGFPTHIPSNKDICSHFKHINTPYIVAMTLNSFFLGTGTSAFFCFKNESGGTIQEFKDYITAQKNAGTPIQVCYKLATPQTYLLTPQQIMTLLGTNNVWTDIGNVSVKYPADTKMFIEKLTMPTEDDLVANQAITSGKYFMIGNSLYLALANIASGAQITIGTNAQRVSLADALNTINS